MNRSGVAGLAAGCAAAGDRLLMEPQMAAMSGWPDVLASTDPIRSDPRGHCLQLGFESLPLLIDMPPPPGSVWFQSGRSPMGPFGPAYAVIGPSAAPFVC